MTKRPTLLRIEQVFERVGFQRNKLYDLINEGAFPKPMKIGRLSAWVEAEVDQWIADRIAERDAKAPKKAPVRDAEGEVRHAA
jgi:prophage regulatory protein